MGLALASPVARLVVFTLFLILFSFGAQAQGTKMLWSEGRVEVFAEDVRVTPQMAAEVGKYVLSAIEMFPTLDWPAKVHVGLMYEGANFFAFGNTIFGAYNWKSDINEIKYEASFEKMKDVWIHELGHVLMMQYLSKAWKSSKHKVIEMIRNEKRKDGSSLNEVQSENLGLLFEKPGFESLSHFGQGHAETLLWMLSDPGISTKSVELNHMFNELMKKANPVQPYFFNTTMPYQEIIADLLSAAFTRNPDAVSKDLTPVLTEANAQYRSFRYKAPLTKGFWLMSEPIHTLFTPARKRVGELFNSAKTPDDFARLISRSIRAATEIVSEQWVDGKLMFHFTNVLNAVAEASGYMGERKTNDKGIIEVNKSFARLNRQLISRIQFKNSCAAMVAP